MGAAAMTASSGQLRPDLPREEAALYEAASKSYDSITSEMKDEEQKQRVYNRLKIEYEIDLDNLRNDFSKISIGDVVKAKVDGLYFEGVITSLEGYDAVVDFGDGDVQAVPMTDCRRVQSWEVLEVGDMVQVRSARGHLMSMAKIIDVTSPPGAPSVYVVDYNIQRFHKAIDHPVSEDESSDCDDHSDEPDLEHDVTHDRVRKLSTSRCTAANRWKTAFRKVLASNLFMRNASEKNKQSFFEEEKQQTANLPKLLIGDVVLAKPPGESLAFEGVILGFDCNLTKAHVHFGKPDEDGGEADTQWCAIAMIQKVHNWDHCEVGDKVKAQAAGEALWFDATVHAVFLGSNLHYTVHWGEEAPEAGKPVDDDDLEHKVTPDRIRKVESCRTYHRAKQWKNALHVVKGARAFSNKRLLDRASPRPSSQSSSFTRVAEPKASQKNILLERADGDKK